MNLNGKVKIVFFDFDWTLFDHRTYEIKPSALKAINLLKDNGIKIVINTGRSYYSLLEKDGKLNSTYTDNGVYLNKKGYEVLIKNINSILG